MEFEQAISRLALSLGIGLLVGLERGWRTRDDRPGTRTAGIRTFALTGMLGGVAGGLAHDWSGSSGAIVFGLAFLGYSAVMAAFCLEENRTEGSLSATTWVAAVLTFALGGYAVAGDPRLAAAVAVAATAILALREPIHGWVERLTWPEWRSGLVLLAMTFIALPIAPGEPVGPFGGVNPREVWVIAIVLAAASFVGYAAVKYFGASHGVLLAGLAGGLASSTAVTIANARRAAAHEGSERLLAAGVALASAVMFLRVIAIVLAVNASLLGVVAPPLLAAAAVAIGYGLATAYWREPGGDAAQTFSFRNPFDFWQVVGFAVLLGVVIVLGRAVGEWLGPAWAIAGAAVVGLADVDAITVSMARLAPQTLSMHESAAAILVAVTTDTISKIGIGAALGHGRFAREIALMAAASLAAGAAVYVALVTLG